MNGSVEALSIDAVRQNTSSSQSRLTSFGTSQTTYIGIVRSPQDAFEDVVDEIEPRLSPPESLFYHWLNVKSQYEDEGMPTIHAHNEAIDTVNYVDRFEDYLKSEPAQAAMRSILDRVEDGERIVLVCYCGEGKTCHREMVIDRIKELREQRVDA